MFEDAIDLLVSNGEIPKFNKAVAEGVGYTQAKDGIHDRVNAILKRELTYSSSNPHLPEGLEYVGYRHMSPIETYAYRLGRPDSKGKKNRRGILVAETDTYMISTEFSIPGYGPLYRPMFLPFLRRGGLMRSWGTTYHVAPVIHTPGICVEHNGLFVNFDFSRKTTLQYCKGTVKMLVNGRDQQVFIPGTSTLYGGSGSGNDNGPKPLPYWIFGKYGFTEGIRKFTGANVFIYPAYKAAELDLNRYVVIMSGERTHAREIQYVLVADKSSFPSVDGRGWDEEEHVLLVMCGAFFRAAHFYAGKKIGRRSKTSRGLTPLFTRLDIDSEQEDIDNLNAPDTWKEILGRSHVGGAQGDVDLLLGMEKHFHEIERYVNNQVRGELIQSDPDIDPNLDIFGFLYYVVRKMTFDRLKRTADLASMFGKKLTVIDYMLLGRGGFNSTVSNLRWTLEGLSRHDKLSDPRDLGSKIKDKINFMINSNMVRFTESGNGAKSTFNASTESMVLAISTHAISQTETDSKGGKTNNLNDRTKHASASYLQLGNIYNIPKSSPFKFGILNQYMKTSYSLTMLRNPKFEEETQAIEMDMAKIGN